VLDEVMAQAQRVSHVRCVGPRGGHVDVPGTLAVLPRCSSTPSCCARPNGPARGCCMPARFEAPLLERRPRCGRAARLKVGEPGRTNWRARWVVLATGAVPQGLMAAGLCDRRTPSGVALRGYVKNDAMVGRIDTLEMVWHRRLAGRLRLDLPGPGGLFNIGAGPDRQPRGRATGDGGFRMQDVNLRQMFDAFCASTRRRAS
jgi:hypothetical protein